MRGGCLYPQLDSVLYRSLGIVPNIELVLKLEVKSFSLIFSVPLYLFKMSCLIAFLAETQVAMEKDLAL